VIKAAGSKKGLLVSLSRWIDSLIANGVTHREDSGTETRRIDTLKYLSDIHRSQIDSRQKLEWRVFFTALTFYVLVPVAVNTKGIGLPKEWWLSWVIRSALHLAFHFSFAPSVLIYIFCLKEMG
jgi:hypothetical protein